MDILHYGRNQFDFEKWFHVVYMCTNICVNTLLQKTLKNRFDEGSMSHTADITDEPPMSLLLTYASKEYIMKGMYR